jgi:Uma2 family endonuclease
MIWPRASGGGWRDESTVAGWDRADSTPVLQSTDAIHPLGATSMSTITESTSPGAPTQLLPRQRPPGFDDQRIVIRDLDWDLYDRLSDAIGERQHVYLAYDGKDMEIMTKGRAHEVYRDRFGRFIHAVTFELRIRCRGAGETTWKRPEIARGLESDLSYYFEPAKLEADARSLARKSNSVADYPNPDMAIEIDISPPQIDRSMIYAALQVAELWRFDGQSVVIEQLGPDGQYQVVATSKFLPLKVEDIRRWLIEEDSDDEFAWEIRLREWARGELAARLKK